MPSRKKKYNARFPAGRIKKIMQSDDEIGKVAQAVPVIISRTLELFVESLLMKSLRVTNTRNAKTISISHMKYTIMQESRFDFLRELVKNIPDVGVSDDGCNDDSNESPEEQTATTPNINLYNDNQPQDQPINLSCNKASTSRSSHLNGSAPSTPTTSTTPSPRLPSTPSTSVQLQKQYSPFTPTSSTPTSSKTSGKNIHQQPQQSQSSAAATAATDNNDNIATMRLKRQWQHVRTMRGQIAENNDPAKLLRTNSTPTDLVIPTTPNQRSRGRTRGVITHQPKSVPTTPLTPIVRVDFGTEPIIKIDFTNTNLNSNLHDNSQSSSSGRGAAERTNQSGSAGAEFGPVVNIDLSNFAALTTAAAASSNNKIPTVAAVPSTSSIIELDEDYDNI